MYAIRSYYGNKAVIKKMRTMQQPWSINSLAACAAEFLPVAGEYLKCTEAWLKTEKEWMYRSLCTIPGLRVFEPHTNFILVKLPEGCIDAESYNFV